MFHPNSHIPTSREIHHRSRQTYSQMLFESFAHSLQEYEKKTGIELSKHPLVEQLQDFDSAESVTAAILQEQAPTCSDDRITKSLSSVVSILHALSVRVGLDRSIPLVEPIYAGFAILLATASVKDAGALDMLVDLFQSIESILKHLDICTKVPHEATMTMTIVKTVAELLSILALATNIVTGNQIQPGESLLAWSPGMFVKKPLGDNFDQLVLGRLDRLTLDEGRITASQILNVVYGLVQNLRVVMEGGKSSRDGIWDDLKAMHDLVSGNMPRRHKLQQDIQSWLSPPDPSKNHKIACRLHHTGTTAWFLQSDTFSEWTLSKTSSLLWIHGKPGAGKTILCSAIIQDIDTMKRAGLVSLAYYYFDFRDDKQKDLCGLVSSLLVQLCHQSDSYCDMVSKFYSKYTERSCCPSDAALVSFLKRLVRLPGQAPVYLIVDALDECPTTSGMPSAREEVLMLVRQLATSQYSNLRVCATSRLEPDLSVVLGPLSLRSISLHDESGQKEDVASYIKSVVHTDTIMQTWRAGDKELVTNVISHKAKGIFKWASCQFIYLRHCTRNRIQHVLEDLPETLDETYRRILRDIDKADRALAHRLFSCVSVARRPLRVEELAILLAFDFKRGPSRQFRRGWRQEDLVTAIQTKYSSLFAIVKNESTTVIQFSHLSVQEFFENSILANASADISYYHVPVANAHTFVAQACLDVLLRADKNVVTRDNLQKFPLAEYAAEHWLSHVRSGNLSNDMEDRMEQLFDPRKPHLAVFLWRDDPRLGTGRTERPLPLTGAALHYAALWGLHTIVKFLVIERSQDVQVPCFAMATPLHQAAKKGHVEVTRFLIDHGAGVHAQDKDGFTPLHLASQEGQLEVARFLIDRGADVHARSLNKLIPLHLALQEDQLEVARFLIDHGANVHLRDIDSFSPLHLASREGQLEVACFLIDQGADVHAQGVCGSTPLHLASQEGQLESARILVDHGADVNAGDTIKFTPLHLALREGQLESARFLIKHGADVNAMDKDGLTPLHLASQEGQLEVAGFLINHGAGVNARDTNKLTPLHLALREGQLEVAGFLIDYGADVNAGDMDGLTPLHLASRKGQIEAVSFLIDHGADVDALDLARLTPLHLAVRGDQLKVVHFLLNHGADVNTRDMDNFTPLHLVSRKGQLERARFLINRGADVNAGDMDSFTPLHLASQEGQLKVVRFLIDRGAYVHARDTNRLTPLHLASREGQLEVAGFLIDHGAYLNARDMDNFTPLHLASREGQLKTTRFLIERGADVHARDMARLTPLHLASREGQPEVVRFLIDDGADVNARDTNRSTPLHLASREGRLKVTSFLIKHGAYVDVLDMDRSTPLHLASREGRLEVARFLIEQGADVDARDMDRSTPLHLTSREGQLEIAHLLITYGADMDARDMARLTPLHLASRAGHLEVTRTLIGYGADVNVRDMYGFTPLHLASREGRPHVAGVLLENGTDADARDDGNCIPLHLASQEGHLEVVRVLIEHGTDINARDYSNWTPLHGASQEGHLNVVNFLLDHGADLHVSDHGGWTSLQLPSHSGDLEIVRVLLKHGANANTRDNNHWTPLHGASQCGHLDVIRLLLEHGADSEARDDSNQTPSHVAARAGFPKVLPLLGQSGANIHARNNEGRTPLEEASANGHNNTVREDIA